MTSSFSTIPPVAALILAGGENRRMNGKAKILLPLGQHTLLQRLLNSLQPQVRAIALSYNDPLPAHLIAEHFSHERPVLKDNGETREGPLAGIQKGLEWLKPLPACEWLLTVPGDTPFLPDNLVTRLFDSTVNTPISKAHYICWQGRDHFLTGLWHASTLPVLTQYLASGQRSAKGFLASLNSTRVCLTTDAVVASPTLKEHLFFNINTPNDHAKAKAIALEQRSQ